MNVPALTAHWQKISLLPGVQTALYLHPSGLFFSQPNQPELQTVVAQLQQKWQDEPTYPVQIQILTFPTSSKTLLAYAHQLTKEQGLLMVLAETTTPVETLRQQIQQLLTTFEKMEKEKVPALPPSPSKESPLKNPLLLGKTYAIAWRPIASLPTMLHIPLRRALERIAHLNQCTLYHLQVTNHLIHLVVSCPPGQNSLWVAQQFKNGSESQIQQQLAVQATLWAKGYYAKESMVPLSLAEINLFLEQSQPD